MTTAVMRWMLLVAGAFVVIADTQLFVLTEHTERYVAWSVDQPLTAAFLGAGYWASAVLELLRTSDLGTLRVRLAGRPARSVDQEGQGWDG